MHYCCKLIFSFSHNHILFRFRMPASLLPMVFFISILSSIITHSHSQCLDDQKSLLLGLKNELIFNSSISRKLVQWNQTDDCCSWYGVECDGAGHVKGLQLDNEAISGGLGNSSCLFRLKYLEKLNLAYNKFNYTQIPSAIQNLSNLTHLNLANAAFGGQVPVELLSLRRLVSLDISNTYWIISYRQIYDNWEVEPLKLEFPNLEMLVQNLTGLRKLYLDSVNISSQRSAWSHIIPSYLPDLENLSLCYCSVSGPIDKSLSQLHSLSVLRLDGNNLAIVPNFFSNFSSLTTLSLRNCSLKGYFPKMVFHIPTLQNLDLSQNQLLSGTIPQFPQGGSLESLVLGETNFSGLIPSSISNLTTLSKIDLSSCKFAGSIPSTFTNLTKLVNVDLSDNFFTGSLSSMLFVGLSNLEVLYMGYNSFTGRIPQSLFSLPSLEVLSLGQNQFSGRVEEFPTGNVSSINFLYLRRNQLEGPFPDSLFHLQSLVYLELSHNLFNGTFQLEKFLSLPNLRGVDLSYNNLTVHANNLNSTSYRFLQVLHLASCNLYSIPEFIKHSDISVLDLSSNRIAGEVPSWIWGIGSQLRALNLSSNLLTGLEKPFHIPSSLNELDLSSNQLQGELHLPIPHTIGDLKSNLWYLSVENNSLRGSIPTSLCSATGLSFLDLSVNKFSGNIPPCLLEKCVKLEMFNLGRNNISGDIPDMFPLHCSLRTFDLHKNSLQGKIPKSLESCKSLEFMNVGNNVIHDSFPCMLSSRLRVLVLRFNRFHGEVRCDKSWPDLQIADISSNNFSGSLESVNFSTWSAMKLESDPQLRPKHPISNLLHGSRFYNPVEVTLTMKGIELKLVKIWPEFTAIDFSCNSFHGEVPDAIGGLISLYLLNLSHNALDGGIPQSFGKLGTLGSLDLSQNQFTGRIPVELAGLTFLSFLNLSYNKLVGEIPNGRQFLTFSVDSFKGNPRLCGFPLNIKCSNTDDDDVLSPPEHENVDSEREIEWEYVSAALGYVVGLGTIICLLLFCRSFRDKYFGKVEEVVEEIFDGRNKRRRRRARRVVVRRH